MRLDRTRLVCCFVYCKPSKQRALPLEIRLNYSVYRILKEFAIFSFTDKTLAPTLLLIAWSRTALPEEISFILSFVASRCTSVRLSFTFYRTYSWKHRSYTCITNSFPNIPAQFSFESIIALRYFILGDSLRILPPILSRAKLAPSQRPMYIDANQVIDHKKKNLKNICYCSK